MVLVLDAHQKPFIPCPEKRAHPLRERGRAVVHRPFPFAIGLQDRTDPDSKTAGPDRQIGAQGICFGEFAHHPHIEGRLQARVHGRRGRRVRHPRYRPARFAHRRRPQGWLPPSLTARVGPTLRAVAWITRLAPITALSVEHVAFDTQTLDTPEIVGVQDQQGTLPGYEVREFLLATWGHRCAYDCTVDVPVEAEPRTATIRGGSDRIANLTIACRPCNDRKDAWALEGFLTRDRGRRQRAARKAKAYAPGDLAKLKGRARWETHPLDRVQQQPQTPLRDAAARPGSGLPSPSQAALRRCPGGRGKAPGTVYRPTHHRAGGAGQGARCQQVCRRMERPGIHPRQVPSILRAAQGIAYGMVGFFNVRMGDNVNTNRGPSDDGCPLSSPGRKAGASRGRLVSCVSSLLTYELPFVDHYQPVRQVRLVGVRAAVICNNDPRFDGYCWGRRVIDVVV